MVSKSVQAILCRLHKSSCSSVWLRWKWIWSLFLAAGVTSYVRKREHFSAVQKSLKGRKMFVNVTLTISRVTIVITENSKYYVFWVCISNTFSCIVRKQQVCALSLFPYYTWIKTFDSMNYIYCDWKSSWFIFYQKSLVDDFSGVKPNSCFVWVLVSNYFDISRLDYFRVTA